MEHYWKTLREQLHILGMKHEVSDLATLEFCRVHAWAVVQLCDEILSVDGGMGTAGAGGIGERCRG